LASDLREPSGERLQIEGYRRGVGGVGIVRAAVARDRGVARRLAASVVRAAVGSGVGRSAGERGCAEQGGDEGAQRKREVVSHRRLPLRPSCPPSPRDRRDRGPRLVNTPSFTPCLWRTSGYPPGGRTGSSDACRGILLLLRAHG